jgi:Uma2 family endonuclease
MTVATARRMSLEDYLTYDDGTDTRYELEDGVLVEMGVESTTNTLIASFFFAIFLGMGVPYYRIGIKQKIQVTSSYVSARDPDLIIHTEASALVIKGRKEACLKLREPNPMIVIEVVSPGEPGTPNYDDLRSVADHRDYEHKPNEYAARGIPEMWQIDPERSWVKVGKLVDGDYDFETFTGNMGIGSPSFPGLTITADEVLTAGN